MLKQLFVAALLIAAPGTSSAAQSAAQSVVQSAVQSTAMPADLPTALAMVVQSAGAIPENLRTPRLAAALQWMRNNVAKTPAGSVSPEYVRSLARAAEVLRTQPTAAAIEDVTRELEAKVEHCRRLGVGMGGSVLLRVNTRRDTGIVGEWQVLYLLKFDEWLKTLPRNFARVSSPTEMQVEPGRYWIWARDPATGALSDRVLVEVAGRQEMLLDLPVK